MPKGGTKCEAFSAATLKVELGTLLEVEYLAEYLLELKAASMVIERHYVDRHFLEDYTDYYSRSFNAPPPTCERLHFFSDLDAAQLKSLLQTATKPDRKAEERELQQRYLGFVVKRPLKSAPIGRTVLSPYPAQAVRRYEVVRPYHVNILTFRLKIDGLAYQQQDRGAAVCASTALWSALQRVAQVSGHRTPTPSAVTRAAKSPFPASSGLDLQRMATALSSLGYSADYFAPLENRALFRAKVTACLESALPVILLITRVVETQLGRVTLGHAVTATGYRGPLDVTEVPAPTGNAPGIAMRGGSLKVLYVHDDNLGSHAHYELSDVGTKDENGHQRLALTRGKVLTKTWDITLAPGAELWCSGRAKDATSGRPVAAVAAKRPTVLRSLLLGVDAAQKGGTVALSVRHSPDFGATWHQQSISVDCTPGKTSKLPLALRMKEGDELAVGARSTVGCPVSVQVQVETAPTIGDWPVDDWMIFGALVPKPDKVRLPLEELFLNLHHIRALLGKRVFSGVEVDYAARFAAGVDYRAELTTLRLHPQQLQAFLEDVPLPRHVGVVSLSAGSTRLCDLVIDVTEVVRDRLVPAGIALIAPGVPSESPAHANLTSVAANLGWHFVGQEAPPPTPLATS